MGQATAVSAGKGDGGERRERLVLSDGSETVAASPEMLRILDAAALSNSQREALLAQGVRFYAVEEHPCPVCGRVLCESVLIELPGAEPRGFAGVRCRSCGVLRGEDTAHGTRNPSAVFANFVAELRDRAEEARAVSCRREATAAGVADACQGLIGWVNMRIAENNLPVTPAARDAIIAAAIGDRLMSFTWPGLSLVDADEEESNAKCA